MGTVNTADMSIWLKTTQPLQ